MPDSNEEVSKQNEEPVQLDQEARQGPAEEDEEDTDAEGGGALELLGPGEEDQCLLDADDESQADQKEDLGGLAGCGSWKWCTVYVAHGQPVNREVSILSPDA